MRFEIIKDKGINADGMMLREVYTFYLIDGCSSTRIVLDSFREESKGMGKNKWVWHTIYERIPVNISRSIYLKRIERKDVFISDEIKKWVVDMMLARIKWEGD